VQDGQENGALDRELESAAAEQLLEHRPDAALLPQPAEQERRSDALAAELRHAAVLKQRQDHRTPRQAGGGTHQAVEVATAPDLFLATEIADDPLPGPGPLADGLDQVDVGVRTDALFADEHAPSIRHLCVVSSNQTHQAV
jgi:predicted ABC-type transport system involved in lysophospholipase L1 biosynthesis ATPase subunit